MVIGGLFLLSVNLAATNHPDNPQFYQDYEPHLHKFHQEIEVSLALRKGAIEFFKQEMLEGENQYFDARDILHIQSTVDEYAKNRAVLLEDIANHYRQIIDDVELVLSTQKPTALTESRAFLGIGKQSTLLINPTDDKGRQYIQVLKLGLAAALTLYDNFKIAISPFQDKGHFRRKINYDNLDNQKILEEISGNFRRLDNYKDTLKVVEFNDQLMAWERDNPHSVLVKDKDNAYFNVLIQGSYTNAKIKQVTIIDRLSFRTLRFRRIIRDFLFEMGNDTLDLVSKGFGNGMGLIATREGYLKNIPLSHKQRMQAQLEAGDILLEKTPFRLTDRFIPGHWGHVAIWVGTKSELQALGVWDELPAIYAKAQKRLGYLGPSFQQQVMDGRNIIEALRPGVEINTLDHFLNIDDMAVLRDKQVDNKAMKRYLIRAFEQVGKEYDFNFDVETDTKIVCSELAFVTFDDYAWPVEKTAGRYTISPDHIGEKATANGPFEPVMLYHNGKEVVKDVQLNFSRLMNADYEAVQQDLAPIF